MKVYAIAHETCIDKYDGSNLFETVAVYFDKTEAEQHMNAIADYLTEHNYEFEQSEFGITADDINTNDWECWSVVEHEVFSVFTGVTGLLSRNQKGD